MSSGRHPPRRPPVEDYWRAYEASVAPPPGSAARNLERLRARVRAGEVVDEPRDEDRPRSAEGRPRAAAAGLVLLGKSASVSVGLA
ncbi:MAG: hypothetical protein KDK70_42535, partial [Myxococcales bacterium]|nr:hypothetical protein [Myxococcales bacterium]